LPVVLTPDAADAFIARVVAVNGAGAFTVDLKSQHISGPGGPDVAFEIPAADRMRLLEGLDDIGMTLKHMDDIVTWEKRATAAQPWIQTARDSR
jgi:3-isopropylmalate/(R)-2-methylmalate dehydratase small subunit